MTTVGVYLLLLKGVEHVAEGLCRLAMALMTILVMLQVVLRYLFNAPLSWVEEATVYLMIWMAMIGCGIAVRRGAHVAMTVVVEKLPRRFTRVMAPCSQLAMFTFLLVVAWQGLLLAMSVANTYSPALGLSIMWPYLSVPVGAAFMVVQLVAAMLEPPSKRLSSLDEIA